MVDNDYIKSLDYFMENGIALSDEEMYALEDKLLGEDTLLSFEETVEILTENVRVEAMMEASTTIDAAKVFSDARRQYKAKIKEAKKNIKSGNTAEARKNLKELNAILTKAESYIKSTDFGSMKELGIGAAMSFTLDGVKSLIAFVTIVTAFSLHGGFKLAKPVSDKAIEAAKAAQTAGKDLTDEQIQKVRDDIMDASTKGTRAGAATGIKVATGADLVSNYKTLLQMYNDFRAALKNKNKKKAILNSLNIYRAKSLTTIRAMKKQLVKLDKALS